MILIAVADRPVPLDPLPVRRLPRLHRSRCGGGGQEPDLEGNPALKWVRGRMKIAPDYDGEKFFTVVDGVKMATRCSW